MASATGNSRSLARAIAGHVQVGILIVCVAWCSPALADRRDGSHGSCKSLLRLLAPPLGAFALLSGLTLSLMDEKRDEKPTAPRTENRRQEVNSLLKEMKAQLSRADIKLALPDADLQPSEARAVAEAFQRDQGEIVRLLFGELWHVRISVTVHSNEYPAGYVLRYPLGDGVVSLRIGLNGKDPDLLGPLKRAANSVRKINEKKDK